MVTRRKTSTWKRREKRKSKHEIQMELLSKRQRLILEDLYGPDERKRLEILQKELLSLGEAPQDPAGAIRFNVKFLDIFSKFQDNGYILYQPIQKEKYMERLNKLIYDCGRFPDDKGFKWNRSKKGEKVTVHNVYYGDGNVLPFRTAAYWLAVPKSKKVTVEHYSALAKNPKDPKALTHKTQIWATQALVQTGIEKFNKRNLEIGLKVLEVLLSA